jgi:hypothetical protein
MVGHDLPPVVADDELLYRCLLLRGVDAALRHLHPPWLFRLNGIIGLGPGPDLTGGPAGVELYL